MKMRKSIGFKQIFTCILLLSASEIVFATVCPPASSIVVSGQNISAQAGGYKFTGTTNCTAQQVNQSEFEVATLYGITVIHEDYGEGNDMACAYKNPSCPDLYVSLSSFLSDDTFRVLVPPWNTLGGSNFKWTCWTGDGKTRTQCRFI